MFVGEGCAASILESMRGLRTPPHPFPWQTSEKYKAGLRIKNPEHRLKYFTKCCAGMRYNPATNAPQPQYRLESTRVTAEFPVQKDADEGQGYAEGRQDLPAEKAYEILRRISDNDILALGLNPKYSRPEWFIITVLPISPPPVRPDVMMDSSARAQDDITFKLAEIIRTNAELRRQEQNGAPQHIVQEIGQLLQFHITTMMNNSIPGMPVSSQRSGRPIKSIGQRLKASSSLPCASAERVLPHCHGHCLALLPDCFLSLCSLGGGLYLPIGAPPSPRRPSSPSLLDKTMPLPVPFSCLSPIFSCPTCPSRCWYAACPVLRCWYADLTSLGLLIAAGFAARPLGLSQGVALRWRPAAPSSPSPLNPLVDSVTGKGGPHPREPHGQTCGLQRSYCDRRRPLYRDG